MLITPPFKCRHFGQLLGVAQATRDASPPVTLFVAVTPMLSSDTGRLKGDMAVAFRQNIRKLTTNSGLGLTGLRGGCYKMMFH